MALPDFLRDPKNSVTKERIYFHKLVFDLQLAAAKANYALQLFQLEVDREGFDLVVNDGELERRLQVKTVLLSSKRVDGRFEKIC
jgi:hypothetical protein